MRLWSKVAGAVVVVGAVAATTAWVASAPGKLDDATLAGLGKGDVARGERMFWAGGCASCHAKPRSEGAARLELAGGTELETPFGVFVAPNISQHPQDGIGDWSLEQFATAMLEGVSPDGQHYYPAFPYTSYARMKPSDVSDLYAFMKTLPQVAGKAGDHRLSFPFTMRRGLGLWKQIYLHRGPVVALAEGAPQAVLDGRYLVEGPGHCGECHTPRDAFGGLDTAQWLAGAPAAEGEGVVPNITGGEGGIGDWSEGDLAGYFETGFTPDFDTVGGAMVEVQKNLAQLSDADRQAIAAYLKAAPQHPDGYEAQR